MLVGANPPVFPWREAFACFPRVCLDARGFCWEPSHITDGGFSRLGAEPGGPFMPWALNQAGVMQSSPLSLWLLGHYSLCPTTTTLGLLSASLSWPKHAHSCDKVPYSAPDSMRISQKNELQKFSRINIPCWCQELPKLKSLVNLSGRDSQSWDALCLLPPDMVGEKGSGQKEQQPRGRTLI